MGFLWMIDCARVRSALLSNASDVILQRCMFSPSFPKAGYSEKCTTLLRGTFSLWASSHLIKQAQEMSLLADWPCVFLRRPPTGTADVHSVSLWQRNHLTCPSPNSYINFLFASLLSFNTKSTPPQPFSPPQKMIIITFILTSPYFFSSPAFHSSPIPSSPPLSPPPPPFHSQPLVFLP